MLRRGYWMSNMHRKEIRTGIGRRKKVRGEGEAMSRKTASKKSAVGECVLKQINLSRIWDMQSERNRSKRGERVVLQSTCALWIESESIEWPLKNQFGRDQSAIARIELTSCTDAATPLRVYCIRTLYSVLYMYTCKLYILYCNYEYGNHNSYWMCESASKINTRTCAPRLRGILVLVHLMYSTLIHE